MKILYLAGRELEYQRNDVLLRALSKKHEVTPIGFSKRPRSLIFSSIIIALKALPHIFNPNYQIVFIGFYGYLLALLFNAFRKKPILFDAFTSNYDTLVNDRQILTQNSFAAKIAYWMDQYTCQTANHILLDTNAHVQYFSETFKIPPFKFSSIPVGCNESIFPFKPLKEAKEKTTVLFYSSYLPLHGVDVIVNAASKLKNENIKFRIIGDGSTKKTVVNHASQLKLKTIEFLPSVSLSELSNEIANCDICLGGHFGSTTKAGRVIPGKIYQILAVGRPLIAANTQANSELLSDGENAILCPPGDPNALAFAIQQLHQNIRLREQLASMGYHLFLRKCSEEVIKDRLEEILIQMVNH